MRRMLDVGSVSEEEKSPHTMGITVPKQPCGYKHAIIFFMALIYDNIIIYVHVLMFCSLFGSYFNIFA